MYATIFLSHSLTINELIVLSVKQSIALVPMNWDYKWMIIANSVLLMLRDLSSTTASLISPLAKMLAKETSICKCGNHISSTWLYRLR